LGELGLGQRLPVVVGSEVVVVVVVVVVDWNNSVMQGQFAAEPDTVAAVAEPDIAVAAAELDIAAAAVGSAHCHPANIPCQCRV